MKKTLLVSTLLILVSLTSWAQFRPQYSQYMVNQYVINPAIGGIEDYWDVNFSYRNQWTGIDGAPETTYFSIHGPLYTKRKPMANPGRKVIRPPKLPERDLEIVPHLGVGMTVLSDKAGPFSRNQLLLSYSYHQPLTERMAVAVGFSGGILQHRLNTSMLQLQNPNDALIGSGNENNIRPDLSLGVYLYSPQFYLGVTVAQILQQNFDFGEITYLGSEKQKFHYIATVGYRIQAGKTYFTPSVMVKALNPAEPTIDFNLRMVLDDRVWAGMSYRTTDTFVLLTGFAVNDMFSLSYSYDIGNEGLTLATSATHEVILGVKLRNRYKVLCPQNVW